MRVAYPELYRPLLALHRVTISRQLFLLLLPLVCFGQKNELAFGLGGIPAKDFGGSPAVSAGPGPALQVNYGRRFFSLPGAAIYGEINMIASPLRDVRTTIPTATRDFASLYLTPGVRLKLMPSRKVSPYVVVGAGYADYEQSTMRINSSANSAPRQLGRAAFDFGGGADVHIWRFLALRGEARDFVTGAPAYNVTAIQGAQQNVVITGAFVLRWH
jgi:hypothetical protein